jgi:hypothetical protein
MHRQPMIPGRTASIAALVAALSLAGCAQYAEVAEKRPHFMPSPVGLGVLQGAEKAITNALRRDPPRAARRARHLLNTLAQLLKATNRLGEAEPLSSAASRLRPRDFHPIPRNREESGFQTGPYLLATRERAHIVAPVAMTIEELSLSGTRNRLFFYGLLHGISRCLHVDRIKV